MKYLTNRLEAKELDRYTIHEIGIPSLVLMERASLLAAEEADRLSPKNGKILILCGMGNNGADGLAMARMLSQKGHEVIPWLFGDPLKATEENKAQQKILANMNIPVTIFHKEGEAPGLPEADVIVDALFGVGLSRPLGEYDQALVRSINEAAKNEAAKTGNAKTGNAKTSAVQAGDAQYTRKTKVLAADLPSGISADTGEILGEAVQADVTVTFGFEKPGLYLFPGSKYAGNVVRADIGLVIPEEMEPKLMKSCDSLPDLQIPARDPAGNKGSFGKLLLIAGSEGMCGASFLAAKAAYLCGAGLVQIYTEKANRVPLQTMLPEAIVTVYDAEAPERRELEKAMKWADAIVCGPGLSRSDAAMKILRTVMKNAQLPLVLDADALNLISEAEEELLPLLNENMILTPHMGEMARLTGKSVKELKADPVKEAKEFREKTGANIVLKDARTVIAAGTGTYLNTKGNCGMATGGSGDTLAGIIGGLLVLGMDVSRASVSGVFLHSLAGDLAAEEKGQAALLAGDISEAAGRILRKVEREGVVR